MMIMMMMMMMMMMMIGFSAVRGNSRIHPKSAIQRQATLGREAVLRRIIEEVGPVAVLVPERWRKFGPLGC